MTCELAASLRELIIRYKDVGLPPVEVDPYAIVRAYIGKAAAHRGLGRSVEDRRRARGAGLAPVTNAGKCMHAATDERSRRLHIHNFNTTGIADRPRATNDKDTVL